MAVVRIPACGGEGGGGGGGKVSKSKMAEYSYSEYENIFIQTHNSIYICLGLPTSTYQGSK